MTNVALVAKKLSMLEEHLRRLRERRPTDLAFEADALLQDAVAMSVLVGGATQIRNRIAHGYASLDAGRLWNELPAGIAAFAELSRAVGAFLQRAP